jgi:quercetin dioxygenase-like cupin family protein
MVTVRSLNDVKQIGTEFDLLGVRVEFLARPKGQSLSIIRSIVPAGVSVPLHSHADVEGLYLTEGELGIYSGSTNEWVEATKGQFVHVPGNEPHAVRNLTSDDAGVLLITTDRLGNFFDEIGVPISGAANHLMPSPERLQHFSETAARYGYWLANPEENAAIGINL